MDYKGLTQKQVVQLRKKYGFNEIKEKKEGLLKMFVGRLINPITVMIELALVLSLFAHKYEDAVIILLLLVVNIGVDLWQTKKAQSALQALKDTLAHTTYVLREGKFISLPVRNLVPGDIVKIVIGDIVPADVTILSDDLVSVDQSTITGESLPVEKKKGELLYSSSIIQKGSFIAKVEKTGKDTFIGKSVDLVARAEANEESHFQRAVINIGKFLTVLSVVLVSVMTLMMLLRGESWLDVIQLALVLIIASIPVALPAVLSVVMAVGAANLSKHKAIVSNFKAVEELAGVDMLCVDKTGTLTKNQLTIRSPFAYEPFNEELLFKYAFLASEPTHKNNIEQAIEEYARREGHINNLAETCEVLDFTPFTPETKVTKALVNEMGVKKSVIMGAPQVIAESVTSEQERQILLARVDDLAKDGFRALAVAVDDDESVKFVGLLPMFDPPRDDTKSVIDAIRGYGVKIKMITGDNTAVARYIAHILGLGKKILSARELEKESDKSKIIESTDIFTEVVPEDKYNIIDTLQKNGHIVAMTGDGVNDAPALKKADIGIAVSGASPAARSAADVVLLGDGLRTIQESFKLARMTFSRMLGYSTFRIAETIRIVLFVSLSVFIFGFTPLSAIMIVLLALLNDIPVMAMAYDNAPAGARPERWNLKEVFAVSSVLGVMGLLASFTLLYVLEINGVSLGIIYTIMFLKMDVAGHSTLYTTRTGRAHFWQKPYPSLTFFLPAFGSRIIGTIIVFFGILMEPISLSAIIAIWIYSTFWFIINDQAKVVTFKILDKFALKHR